jgi:hypothetical protein
MAADKFQLDTMFDAYLYAAKIGARCPTKAELFQRLGFNASDATKRLAAAGKIVVEIYGRNWRVIEIADGPCKGARTAAPPHGGNPYLTINSEGSWVE